MKISLLIATAFALTACVRDVPVGPHDPADANGKTTPVSRGSGVLAADFNADTIAPEAVPAGGHDHHDHGSSAAEGTTYTCPHHPDVVSDKPGKCPKCGMDLVPKKTEPKANPTTYTCSHHPDVVSDKPGKCPKCGMDLVPKKGDAPKNEGHQHPPGGH